MRHRSKPMLAAAVLMLLPLAASAQLVCCMGWAPLHAVERADAACGDEKSCCDQADDDAVARHCCEGGDEARQSQPAPQLAEAPPTAAQHGLGLPAITLPSGLLSHLTPPPLQPDLLTLLSTLLI